MIYPTVKIIWDFYNKDNNDIEHNLTWEKGNYKSLYSDNLSMTKYTYER